MFAASNCAFLKKNDDDDEGYASVDSDELNKSFDSDDE
jgi:hypothetical protein